MAKPYAAHWNVMCYLSRAREGSCPMPNGPMSSYRTYSQQVYLRRLWCNHGTCGNAAVAGTSNHGIGRAVDTGQLQQAYRNGKACGVRPPSDAPWESWHALVRLEGMSQIPKPKPRVLRKGVRPGKDVKAVQKLLRDAGYLPKDHKLQTGYGLKTRRAVRKFQKDHKLPVDGVVGPKTLAALKKAAAKKRK